MTAFELTLVLIGAGTVTNWLFRLVDKQEGRSRVKIPRLAFIRYLEGRR